MLGWLKRLAVPVAAVAAIGFAGLTSTAHADNVQFSTFGTFLPTSGTLNGRTVTETDGSVGSTGSITLSSGSQFATLAFDGVTDSSVTAPINGITFGTFKVVSSTPDALTMFDGTSFTLNIVESVPGSGSGSTVASVVGTVQTKASGANPQTSDVTITFANPTIFIPGTPGVFYTVDNSPQVPSNVQFIHVTNGPNPTFSEMDGDVALAPLPATATMGFGLLGCLGGFGLLRRRRQLA